MRPRIIARLAIFFILAAGIFLVVRAETSQNESVECEESLDGCCRKDGNKQSNKMIWESLPQQFFSSI